jgi:hypothetical protein
MINFSGVIRPELLIYKTFEDVEDVFIKKKKILFKKNYFLWTKLNCLHFPHI